MQLTVVLVLTALSLTTLHALPWSLTDPIQAIAFQNLRNQKQRNLAKVQLLPQKAINFVGPRQATSVEADEDDSYYDDDNYDDVETPVDYAESEEVDYEWR